MEGVAAAASLAGILSLAIQLVETIQDLHSFLTSLADAPDEIQRLAGSLASLEAILQNVRNIAEIQQLLGNAPAVVSSMETTLKECQEDLRPLRVIVEKAQAGFGSQQRIVRKWMSLKVVFKQKDVEAFEKRLQYSMQRLLMSIIANETNISLSIHKGVTILLDQSSQTRNRVHASTLTPTNLQPSQNEIIQQSPRMAYRRISNYLLKYGQIEVAANSRELVLIGNTQENGKSPRLDREKTFSISISLLRRYLQFGIDTTGGGWKFSFTVYQIIPYEAEIWKICKKGDIPGIQRLFSDPSGTWSPFIRTPYGDTLIHYAAYGDQAEMITFLLQLGVNPNLENQTFSPILLAESIDCCRILIEKGQADLHDCFIFGNLFICKDPQAVLWILDQEEFVVEFEQGHISDAVGYLFGPSFGSRESYLDEHETAAAKLLARMLKHGKSLSSLSSKGQTPLHVLLGDAHEFDSIWLVDYWLNFLNSNAGSDIQQYVNFEKEFHSDGFLPLTPWERSQRTHIRRRLIFSERSHQAYEGVSFEWVISPESPAALVLQEFIYTCVQPRYDHIDRDEWEYNWPYGQLDWNEDEKAKYSKLLSRSNRKADQREKRRNRYKIPREYKPRRRGRQMPGSWIEDKFTYSVVHSRSRIALNSPRWLYALIISIVCQYLFHIYLMWETRNENMSVG